MCLGWFNHSLSLSFTDTPDKLKVRDTGKAREYREIVKDARQRVQEVYCCVCLCSIMIISSEWCTGHFARAAQ